jgi:tetratricopeptide (TPR) repeat protein
MLHPMRIVWFSVLLATGFALTACTTPGEPRADAWPTQSALPESPPADLDTEAPATLLRAGSDGFVYVVGLADDAEPGAGFVGRYSGEWPIRDLARPALASGRLVQVYEDGVGLVHLTYTVPDSEPDGLEVEWEPEPIADHIGKGRAQVTGVAEAPSRDVDLDLGTDNGVREGDFYALLAEPAADAEPHHMQLTRRLRGVCMVQEVAADSARCVVWPGGRLHPATAAPKVGQEAVFLEHTFGAAPREALIEIAAVQGGDDSHRDALTEAMRAYLESVTESRTTVTTVDEALEATADDFYREADRVEPKEEPQILVGASIREVNGERRLIGNYTGVGSASGPGMVAAPPEGGVDLGPADAPDEAALRNFAATVWAGMLVYRGQTSEALIHLHQMLADPRLEGPLRWHARDQYAMRWSGLGHVRESLWLVLQDEAVATEGDDRQAWLNALGTRVRLYELLELPARAVSSAKRYLDARADEKPGPTWRSALAMYGEMLMADERVDDAMAVIDELEEACPEGCRGDLVSHVASLFWSVPEDYNEERAELLEFMLERVDEDDPAQLASVRIYQGLMEMRQENHTQALIAFLDAERLYESQNNLVGQARSKYFAFLADLNRGEPQEAFNKAQEAQKLEMELNDYPSMVLIFDRMGALYTNPDFLERPGPYLGAARQVLRGSVEGHVATGDFGKAAESLLGLGGFQFRIGQEDQARDTLTEAVGYAISFQRFDVAALAHLYLAMVARQQGDQATYRDEIEKAQTMADLSDDPEVQEAIDRLLDPEQQEEPPTQLL